MRIPILSLAAALHLCAAAPVQAAPDDDAISPDRPGFANPPDVVGKGRLQLEASVQWDRRRADDLHERAVSTPTLLRIGVGDALELRLETDGRDVIHDVDPASGARTTTTGYADTALGVKWRLAQQQGLRPALALLGEVDLPSGTRELRGRGARPAVYLPASWDLDAGWSLQAMPGVGTDNDERGARYRYGFLALSLGKELSQRWQGFVEVAAPQVARAEHGGTQAAVDGGVTYRLSKDCQLDASVAHGLNKRTPDLSVAFGVSIRR
ncbi:transporter [uncultured Massilia sp.]|uniref:transporter n=1 Tax=uncultured Massilia sp. TaxID=169973 RepID=UPI0025E36A50|nr:transporter [uncultured Massilia sp.]